jgi:restriction system protein
MMNEIAPQRISEFLRAVFLRLWQEDAGLPVADVLAHIPQAIQLTDTEKADFPPTHTPRYARVIRLATRPYVKAGWLVKSKGRWFLTDEGKQACKTFTTAEAFAQEAGRMMTEWRQDRQLLTVVTEEAQEMAWAQVSSFLQELKPYEFQMLVEDLLRAMGYHLAWVAPPEKDRGFVNFVIYSDPLGLSIPRIKVHVLQSGQPVLLEGLKAFISLLGSGDAGIFFSSGGFTSSVRAQAIALGTPRVSLIDMEDFFDLWVEYYEKLTPAGRQRFPLQSINFLASLE